jgi:acetoacetate decarboxylase
MTVTPPREDVTTAGLSASDLRRAMPVTAPLYGEPPFYYRGSQTLMIAYRTSADALGRHLPPGLRPYGYEPIVTAMITDYRFSTFGPYRECGFLAEVELTDDDGTTRPGIYVPYIYVTSEPPLAGGRELWGYSKKLAHIEMGQEADVVWATLSRPEPVRLLTAVLKIDRPAEPAEFEDVPVFSLRVIPSTDPGRYPTDVAQLVEARFPVTPRTATDGMTEAWFGTTASIAFDVPTAVDPIHTLPVLDVVGGYYGTFDAVLHAGQIVRTYT